MGSFNSVTTNVHCTLEHSRNPLCFQTQLMPPKFWIKVASASKGGLKFTNQVIAGIVKCKSQEEYMPKAFSKFMDSLFLNPNFKVEIIREMEAMFSDRSKKILEKAYDVDTIQLGEPFQSKKRGMDFPVLEKNFFYPEDLDFRFQKEFIQRYYPEQMPKQEKCYLPEGRYFPRMHVYNLKENNSGKYLIYFSGGAFTLNHYTIFTQFPFYFPDHNLVFVQYGLAPEYAYPQGIIDAIDAYHIILHKYSPKSIVLAGDSAGGHLALQAAIYVKDHFKAGPRKMDSVLVDNMSSGFTRSSTVPTDSGLTQFHQRPNCLILMSPWTDLSMTGQSVSDNGELDSIKPSFGLHKFRELYLGLPLESNPNRKDIPFIKCSETHLRSMQIITDTDLKRPQFSPVFRDLHGLPPVLIHTGDHEILKSDNQQLAAALTEAGIHHEHIVLPFQVHMIQTFSFLASTKESFTHSKAFADKHTKTSVFKVN